MSDLSHWKLRGPVRTLRSEIAERDYARGEWGAPRFSQFVVFDEDGRLLQLDQRGEGGSVYRTTYRYGENGLLQKIDIGTEGRRPQLTRAYSYDAQSRPVGILQIAEDGSEVTTDTWSYGDAGGKAHVQFLAAARGEVPMHYAIEGGEFFYGAEHAATLTTQFDLRGRPVEALFHDADNVLVRRIARTYDQAGNVQVEEAQLLEGIDLTQRFPEMTTEDREKMMSLVAVAFGATRTEYHYDTAGRVASRTQRTGLLAEHHVTFRYDERGNVIEESERSVSREMNLQDHDQLQSSEDTVRTRQVRFEYRYDRHGNWTERAVLQRTNENDEFQPSNVERRLLEYYER